MELMQAHFQQPCEREKETEELHLTILLIKIKGSKIVLVGLKP
jgi:hypothetical protein